MGGSRNCQQTTTLTRTYSARLLHLTNVDQGPKKSLVKEEKGPSQYDQQGTQQWLWQWPTTTAR